jgi:hypothetical protein
MDKDDIIKNLKLLGEELEELEIQKPVHVLMIGGGYMLTQMGNRSLTEDIDAFTRLDKYGEDYQRFRAAVRFIGSDIHNARWFSDNIGDFMQLVGPIPEGTLWLKHGMLEVCIPEPEYVLVLKLLAGRKKDLDDIQALFQQLEIEERKQARALLQRYVDKMLLDDYRAQVGRLLRKLLKA